MRGARGNPGPYRDRLVVVPICKESGRVRGRPQQTIFVMSRKWSSKVRASGTSRSLKLLTAQADLEFDEHGKVIKKLKSGNDLGLEDTIVVERETPPALSTKLFEDTTQGRRKRKRPSR